MISFKILKIKASENLSICMLIEHDCLCQVKLNSGFDEFGGRDSNINSQNRNLNIMNEENHNLASSANLMNPQSQINLERILIVEFQQLPLIINGIDEIIFDRFERNVFYAVGVKNMNFENSQYENDQQGEISDHVRIEKFFIENDSFSSKTQAFLQMANKEEEVLQYNIAQNQEKVAILTDRSNIYIYNISDLEQKLSNTMKSQQNKNQNRLQTNENLHCYEESKHTTVTREYNFKDSMHTQEMVTQNMSALDKTPLNRTNNNQNRQTEQDDDGDDIKPLTPIAKIIKIGEEISDMKWILNDAFLMIVTRNNNLIIFDSLLYAFNLSHKNQNSVGTPSKFLQINLKGQIAKLQSENNIYQIKGFQQPQTNMGIHLQNQNQFDPETWLSSALQLINYCLLNSNVLTGQQITKVKIFQLYKISHQRQDFDYFNHTIEYFFTKLCLKYLSLKMYEEALYIAFEMDSANLLNQIKVLAKKQRNTIIQGLIDFHKEKNNPGSSANSLMKSLIQIANFSKKQLKKEDFSNLYKDFDTLLRIDDISDLELSDFNSWEINLDDYQKALDFEFEGKFEEAMKIYEQNNLNNDIFRVKSILNELSKEVREGERHLIFEDIKKFINN
ncbi:UNKNOWN [Stylonychia lemnae]|uniref:Uncharacterized protein n=1 Tax=Stylonychia lemnae TaxID=5949 RepID=A0A078A3C4_STYLE|nr:UNKNOWN [Stylonychia lemnae]|eukprot:CDW76778.1 UNKNOWN [Stylonychia lemnae]